MRRARGFTLVELMVVVAITSVLGGIAVVTWRKSRTRNDIDNWATQFRNLVMQASRRAIATQSPFMIDVRGNRLQYCQLDAASFTTAPPYSTTQTACPSTLGENGMILRAPNDAQIAFYAASADTQGVVATTASTKFTMPASQALYLGRNSTASTVFSEVMSNGVVAGGFTAYIRRNGTDETNKRRKVVVYGMSARSRIIDNY